MAGWGDGSERPGAALRRATCTRAPHAARSAWPGRSPAAVRHVIDVSLFARDGLFRPSSSFGSSLLGVDLLKQWFEEVV